MGCKNAECPTQTNLWERWCGDPTCSHKGFVLYGNQRGSGPFVIAGFGVDTSVIPGLGMDTTVIADFAIGMNATIVADFAIGVNSAIVTDFTSPMHATVIPGFIMGAAAS